jgi:hypothetical protein
MLTRIRDKYLLKLKGKAAGSGPAVRKVSDSDGDF